jgi:hypothetical protein
VKLIRPLELTRSRPWVSLAQTCNFRVCSGKARAHAVDHPVDQALRMILRAAKFHAYTYNKHLLPLVHINQAMLHYYLDSFARRFLAPVIDPARLARPPLRLTGLIFDAAQLRCASLLLKLPYAGRRISDSALFYQEIRKRQRAIKFATHLVLFVLPPLWRLGHGRLMVALQSSYYHLESSTELW